MVKPGGTCKPARVISARLAPLPPTRCLTALPPSAWPLAKKKIAGVAAVLMRLSPWCRRPACGTPMQAGRLHHGRDYGRLSNLATGYRPADGENRGKIVSGLRRDGVKCGEGPPELVRHRGRK